MAGNYEENLKEKQEIVKKIKSYESLEKMSTEEIASENGLAHNFVKAIRQEFNITQLRRIYDSIKRIETKIKLREFNKNDVYILVPQAAYTIGRDLAPKEYFEVISFFINKIENKNDFKVFQKFFEAMIAFEKYEDFKNPKKNKGGKK